MSFVDWLSGNNNVTLNKEQYLYGTRHLIIFGIVVVSIIILSLLLKNKSERFKTIFFKTCGWIFLTVEIIQRILKYIFAENMTFSWFMQKLLPLYFCSITVCCLSISLILNNKTMINAFSIMAILVTLAYLIYPAAGLNKLYLSFEALYSISSHSFGFVVAVLLIITGFAKFEFKDIWKTYLIFLAAVIYGIFVTLVAFPNTEDYVFILSNPLGFETSIPYQVIYAVFLISFITIFYLVSFLCKKISNKKNLKTIK